MAQAAADAAAQAGSLSIMKGTNTSAPSFGTGSNPASYTCTTTDQRTPCVYARDNGFGGTTADTVILSYPATVSGVTLLSSAAVPGIAVSVQRTLQTGLIRLVGGPATSSITAKATAGIVGAVSPYCVYVLDPSSADAFSATGGYTMKANGCAIAVNSSSSQAVSITGGFAVTTTKFNDVGGVILTSGGSSTPAVTTGATKVNNPLASLPTLTPGSCSTHPTMFSPASGSTLQPGTYCGGISVGGGASVTFAAGQYIINGGGIGFGGGSSATGSGVLFYLTGTNTLGVYASGAATTYQSVDIGNSVNVTLSAPTSGVYQGILFFQDPSITLRTTGGTNYATFDGGANMKLSGTLYFPTTQVLFDNGITATLSAAIVAWQLTIDASATFTYDSTGTKTGLFSQSVALVQ
jgi:hypothetical protein